MHNTPINPLVADLVSRLDDKLREDFEERAAIMEFEAKLERAHAECLAFIDVLQRNPHVLSRVIVLKVSNRWIVTTDIHSARYIDVTKYEIASVIDTQFGGTSLLTPFVKVAHF